jgi:hypothetical protein
MLLLIGDSDMLQGRRVVMHTLWHEALSTTRESARERERERAPVDARACVSATRSEPPLVVRERKQGGVVPQGADAGGLGVQ